MSEKENKKQKEKKDNKQNESMFNSNFPKFNIYWIYGLIAVAFIGLQFLDFSDDSKEITWHQFEKDMLKAHDVEKVIVINRDRAEVYIIPDRFASGKYDEYQKKGLNYSDSNSPQFYFTIGSVETFEKRMEEAQNEFREVDIVPVSFETRKDHLGDLMSWLMPIIILVAVWLFIFRRMGGAGGPGG